MKYGIFTILFDYKRVKCPASYTHIFINVSCKLLFALLFHYVEIFYFSVPYCV